MELHVNYKPTQKQLLFHGSTADDCFFGGSKGGGKTTGIVMDAFLYCLTYPKANVYLFRKTYQDLRDIIIPEFESKVPEQLYKINRSDHEITLLNGSKIRLRYLENFIDAKKYDGRSMDYIGIDELTEHEEKVIQRIKSCLRSASGYPCRFRATGNPGGISHKWNKKYYIEPTDKGKKKYKNKEGLTVEFIPSSVYEGVLMERDPQYIKRLEALPEMQRKALLEGDWDAYDGQYFGNIDPLIFEDPFIIPMHLLKDRLYGSLDYGYGGNGISAGQLCFIDNDNIPHIIATWHRIGMKPTEQAIDYAEFVKSFHFTGGLSPKEVFCDTNMFANGVGVDESRTPIDYFIDEFYKQFGVKSVFAPANKNRVNGWMNVLDRLTPNILTQKPKMRIWNRYNATLVDSIPQLICDPNRPEDVLKCDFDHDADALRYLLTGIGNVYSEINLIKQKQTDTKTIDETINYLNSIIPESSFNSGF